MVEHTSGCVCEGKCRDVQIKAFEWNVGDGAIGMSLVALSYLNPSGALLSLLPVHHDGSASLPLRAPATFMPCPVTQGPANMDCVLQHHEQPNSFLLQVLCVGYFVSTRKVMNTSVETSSLPSSKNPCH